MKFTQTGLPRSSARSNVPPPTFVTRRLGAGSPTPNRADPDAAGEPNGDADGDIVGEPVAEAEADGDPEGDGEGEKDAAVALAAGDGPGVGWTGPGTKATITPTTMTAVTTPASSPRTMARRGGMAGGYQYQAPEAASPTTR
jgi:hypothetical protein